MEFTQPRKKICSGKNQKHLNENNLIITNKIDLGNMNSYMYRYVKKIC